MSLKTPQPKALGLPTLLQFNVSTDQVGVVLTLVTLTVSYDMGSDSKSGA